MRVVEVRGDGTGLCEGDVEVMLDLVWPVECGDTVLVHAGTALTRVA